MLSLAKKGRFLLSKNLRGKLLALLSDWKTFTSMGKKSPKKIANDIIQLATIAHEETSNENSSLVDYLLTTPIGAPFTTQFSLLEAALSFQEGDDHYHFINLLENFSLYQQKFHTVLFDLLEDLENQEKNS